ncbi:MAG: peptidylprolyl isomerase [Bacteriovoracaceae bacterium]|nr:peptidylprolyl isomerase [Bacteriovoracaceae bacterium]
MKFVFLALVILFSTNLAFSQNDVVATVNGKKITKSQLEDYHQQNLRFISQRKINREVSLDDLINRELGIQKARKTGIDKDPLVISKMEEILYHAQISKDLEGELKKITVSDDEVRKYYSDNKEYRTAHILYRVRVQPTPEEAKKALEQSLSIYEEVSKNPDAFASLANKYSQSTAAPVGGDLGFQPPTRLAPEYYEAIKGQKVGFITRPVRTQMGYHIIKVLGVKEFEQIDKNLYKKVIYDQKRDSILASYFKTLQKGADIKINKNML